MELKGSRLSSLQLGAQGGQEEETSAGSGKSENTLPEERLIAGVGKNADMIWIGEDFRFLIK
jgi:hypothetical protein